MRKRLAAIAALLALALLAVFAVGWGSSSSHCFVTSIKPSAAGTTTVYFPPRDSTSYATYLGLRASYLSVTKVSGSGNDSLFVFGKDFCGGVGRVPMPSNSFSWPLYTIQDLNNGVDSLYIHSGEAGAFLVTMKK